MPIYKKFTELYKITAVAENGVESPKNDYTDKYIALLERQSSLHGLEEKLGAVLNHQQTFYHVLARILSKVEKIPLASAYSYMDKELNDRVEEARRRDKIGIDT